MGLRYRFIKSLATVITFNSINTYVVWPRKREYPSYSLRSQECKNRCHMEFGKRFPSGTIVRRMDTPLHENTFQFMERKIILRQSVQKSESIFIF